MIQESNQKNIIDLFDLIYDEIKYKLDHYYKIYKELYYKYKDSKYKNIIIKFELKFGMVNWNNFQVGNDTNKKPALIKVKSNSIYGSNSNFLYLTMNNILNHKFKTEESFLKYVKNIILKSKSKYVIDGNLDDYIIDKQNVENILSVNWKLYELLTMEDLVLLLKQINGYIDNTTSNNKLDIIYYNVLHNFSDPKIYNAGYVNLLKELSIFIHLIYKKDVRFDFSIYKNFLYALVGIFDKNIFYIFVYNMFLEKNKELINFTFELLKTEDDIYNNIKLIYNKINC